MTAPHAPASDEDRSRAAGDVEAAAAAGLLTLAEADTRLREVWFARTRADVAAACGDLPAEWLAARRRAEAAREAAVRARRALPARFAAWLRLVALLVGIWLVTTPGGYFWPIWPLLGTGVCLLGHVTATRRVPHA